MILDVFDKNFIRIENISRYSYSQYTKELNASGTFEVRIELDNVAKTIKNSGEFILFEKDTLGCITYVNPSTDSESGKKELIIKGYLANSLLLRRCINKTTNFSGTRTSIVRNLVYTNFINPEDPLRAMPIVLSTDPQYIPAQDTEEITSQSTGGAVGNTIESLLEQKEMGYDLVPVLTRTSIQSIEFRVIYGKNRTQENLDGNKKVIFSRSLKNILESSYTFNKNGYKNIAYVAGEGEGSARRVIEIGDTASSGFDRYELYVDARDLQSDNGEQTLTPAEYEKVLTDRGVSKLNENIAEESYSASIDTVIAQFKYGEDYALGDLVTIKDDDLDVVMNARVTKVQVTSIGEKTKVDVTFGYYKMSTNKKLQRNGVI